MQNNSKTVNLNYQIGQNEQKTVWSRILPIFVFLSFVWLNLYDTLAESNSLNILNYYNDISSYVFMSVLMAGLVDYIIFEILFFLYRFCLGFSVYSFMIPKQILMDNFRLWYIIRNVILGVIFNLRFFVPYIGTYLCLFELILDFVFIIGLFFTLNKNHIEKLVCDYVFKAIVIPVVLYEIYTVIVLMVGVL